MKKSQELWDRRGKRVTAALMRIFGDVSDTYNGCCCTAAEAVAQEEDGVCVGHTLL